MDCCRTLNKNSVLYCFPLLFGISSWLGIYATFLQMPIIVENAPEGWSLPSFVVIAIQIGNLGPLLYSLLQKHKPVKDSYLIYIMMTVGTFGALMFSSFYDVHVLIGNQKRSLPMLAAVLLFALTACTSSVLFMPYMGRFPESYIVSYMTGVSCGGLVASTTTLIQGIGSQEKICDTNKTIAIDKLTRLETIELPNFTVRAFFLIIFGIFIISSIAFYLLDTLKVFKDQYVNVTIRHGNDYSYKTTETNEVNEEAAETTNSVEKKEEKLKKISSSNYRNLTILVGVISFAFNAVLPSLLSYATLPFGSRTYHYAITFTYIGEPLTYILSNFVPHSSIRVIWILTALVSIPCSYIGINAFLSPYPLLFGTLMGSIMAVGCWVLAKVLYAFINMSIISVFRAQGGKSLVKVGYSTQIGALLGSLLAFSLINFTQIFKQYNPCTD